MTKENQNFTNLISKMFFPIIKNENPEMKYLNGKWYSKVIY